MNESLKHKEILVKKAKEDLEAAKSLVKSQEFSEEIVLFHCQQAIEKALKAYLDSNNVLYPKTHDLEMLLSMCVEKDGSFDEISFVTAMTPYAVEIRYDEFVAFSKEEISDLMSKTEKAIGFIFSKL